MAARALVDYTQRLIRTSELRRYADWSKADTSSPEVDAKSLSPYRKEFQEELIGKLAMPDGPIAAWSVKVYDQPRWVGYGVELDDLRPDRPRRSRSSTAKAMAWRPTTGSATRLTR